MVCIACVMELNRKFIFVNSSPENFILLLKFLQVLFKSCTCCRGGNGKCSVAKLVVRIACINFKRIRWYCIIAIVNRESIMYCTPFEPCLRVLVPTVSCHFTYKTRADIMVDTFNGLQQDFNAWISSRVSGPRGSVAKKGNLNLLDRSQHQRSFRLKYYKLFFCLGNAATSSAAAAFPRQKNSL
jgi:hypothetical protein